MATERVVEAPQEIARLLAQGLPLRADGKPEEREVAIGWTAADERAEITSFIPSVTRRLLALANAGDFEVTRLYLDGDGDSGGRAILGVEGLLPKELVGLRKRRRSDIREGLAPAGKGPPGLTEARPEAQDEGETG